MPLYPTSLDVASKRKLDGRLQRRIVRMVDKHLGQLLHIFKLTFRHKVGQFPVAPSVANSMEGGYMVGDPGGPHC